MYVEKLPWCYTPRTLVYGHKVVLLELEYLDVENAECMTTNLVILKLVLYWNNSISTKIQVWECPCLWSSYVLEYLTLLTWFWPIWPNISINILLHFLCLSHWEMASWLVIHVQMYLAQQTKNSGALVWYHQPPGPTMLPWGFGSVFSLSGWGYHNLVC